MREEAINCELHDADERISEHIIQATNNTDLVRDVLPKKRKLQQMLIEKQVLKDTSVQVEAMGRQDSTNVSKIRRGKKEKNKELTIARSAERYRTCKYCGQTHPMQKELWPAYGQFCSKYTLDRSEKTYPSAEEKRPFKVLKRHYKGNNKQ